MVDGVDLKDSDYILGNGMQPDGVWGILNPGESYDFGKELEISKYFPKLGEHTLSWKGGGLQSSTIIAATTHLDGSPVPGPIPIFGASCPT